MIFYNCVLVIKSSRSVWTKNALSGSGSVLKHMRIHNAVCSWVHKTSYFIPKSRVTVLKIIKLRKDDILESLQLKERGVPLKYVTNTSKESKASLHTKLGLWKLAYSMHLLKKIGCRVTCILFLFLSDFVYKLICVFTDGLLKPLTYGKVIFWCPVHCLYSFAKVKIFWFSVYVLLSYRTHFFEPKAVSKPTAMSEIIPDTVCLVSEFCVYPVFTSDSPSLNRLFSLTLP